MISDEDEAGLIAGLNFAEEFRASGQAYAELGDDGEVVVVEPRSCERPVELPGRETLPCGGPVKALCPFKYTHPDCSWPDLYGEVKPEPDDPYEEHSVGEANLAMREQSGRVDDDRAVVKLLYLLARDHLPVGVLQGVINEVAAEPGAMFTNGWLASWAQAQADGLAADGSVR